ncbi:MAG: hypothetical protein AB7I38_10985 [Dehalococcoidia bacterium]
MAIGDAYATAAEYLAVTDRVDASENTIIERDLKAVSRLIDSELGRPSGFNKDATATVRIYDPWSSLGAFSRLYIEDLVELGGSGGITIDTGRDNTFATTLVAADYELLPRNAAVGPEVRPYDTIELTSWGSRRVFVPGQRVKVTGIHGWPAVPSAIVTATIELTRIVRLESPRSTTRVNELQQVISTSRVAQGIIDKLLERYRHKLVTL